MTSKEILKRAYQEKYAESLDKIKKEKTWDDIWNNWCRILPNTDADAFNYLKKKLSCTKKKINQNIFYVQQSGIKSYH